MLSKFFKKNGVANWHYVYYVLAGLDLLTVIFSLYLTHSLLEVHGTSVKQSHAWSARVSELNTLSKLAQQTNGPGNDVFDSHDPKAESAKMNASGAKFKAQLVVVRQEISQNMTRDQARIFVRKLSDVDAAMLKMKGEARQIFYSFERGDKAGAGQRMAAMDRAYADLTKAISATIETAQAEHQTFLAAQFEAAKGVRKYEYGIIGMVMLLILMVAFNGTRMGKLVNDQNKERLAREIAEEHLAEQDRLRKEAEEANQAKSIFLANMSHELRTPLNAIIGYSEMVIEDLDAENPAHPSRPDMDRVVGSARHLLSLINEILYLSKVEAGHVDVQRESIQLDMLIDEVIGIAAPLAKKSNVPLIWNQTDLGTIQSDSQKVKQCLLNLISNACKFTSDGQIELSVERGESEGVETVRFIVTDTGIGMTPEQLEKIFKPFQQADSSIEQRYGGTGLGLSITREIARLLGGEIEVESEQGVGTKVTMIIAASIKAQDEVESEIDPLIGSEDLPLVLVIEDEADARELVARSLAPVGYAVQGVSTARAGFKVIATKLPTLIVLDICLPDASGWAFLDQIKREKSLGNIPVVVVSTDDDRMRSIALGAAEHIVKPVHRDVLASTVLRLARSPIGVTDLQARAA